MIKDQENLTGEAAYNLHYVGDQLWEIGEKTLGPVIYDHWNLPVEDETDKKKKKKKEVEEETVDFSAFLGGAKKNDDEGGAVDKKIKVGKIVGDEDKKKGKKGGKVVKATEEVGAKKGKKGKGKKGKKGGDSEDEDDEDVQGEVKDRKPSEVIEGEEKAEVMQEEKGPSPKEMDDWIYEAFMNSLKLSVKDKELP